MRLGGRCQTPYGQLLVIHNVVFSATEIVPPNPGPDTTVATPPTTVPPPDLSEGKCACWIKVNVYE